MREYPPFPPDGAPIALDIDSLLKAVRGGLQLQLCRSVRGEHATAAICRFLEQSLIDGLWKKAASHFGGRGLEQGRPDFTPARKARRWLVKRGLILESKALDVLVCGGAAPGARWAKRFGGGGEVHVLRRFGDPLPPVV